MGSTTIPMLLVTANVGSIFEAPQDMLKIWCEEFLSTVSRLDPKFIALHCQEVGGKNYENSMKHVEHFVKLLMSSNELRLFDKIRVFLDEDYSSAEHFTALGNLYFIHESIEKILIWDFKNLKFMSVHGKEIHSGNIESVITKEKAKFPQDFFPECKWSRKGFLRTRWSLNGTVFDMVNIHLFHDASNFVAMESFPSVYCENRRRALEHTLQRFHNDTYGKVPYFLFGDFNFRTDTDGVVKKITEGLSTTRVQNNKNNDHSKIHFTNEEDKLILSIGKKEFNHLDHQNVFINPDPTWLKPYDKELESFSTYLLEYPITFPPSYPFEEKISHGTTYMQTRCPAWCDRVLLSHNAKQLVNEDEGVEYGLMGLHSCMGDHKPVYLRVNIKENTGTVKCCDHAPHECLPASCQCCQTFASVMINVTDVGDYIPRETYANVTIDSKLLHEPITRDMLAHEPYTPESAESHSPFPYVVASVDQRENPVSPKLLKSRLERVLQFELKSPNVIKRSTSENVEVGRGEDSFFRCRAMSETPHTRKAKLISANSIQRLQSHHSSSDEDWFEYQEELTDGYSECVDKSFEGTTDVWQTVQNDRENIEIDEDATTEIQLKKMTNKQKIKNCCCIL